jgi:hypothetical protein
MSVIEISKKAGYKSDIGVSFTSFKFDGGKCFVVKNCNGFIREIIVKYKDVLTKFEIKKSIYKTYQVIIHPKIDDLLEIVFVLRRTNCTSVYYRIEKKSDGPFIANFVPPQMFMKPITKNEVVKAYGTIFELFVNSFGFFTGLSFKKKGYPWEIIDFSSLPQIIQMIRCIPISKYYLMIINPEKKTEREISLLLYFEKSEHFLALQFIFKMNKDKRFFLKEQPYIAFSSFDR